MKIQIDRKAVRQLISDDADFEVELQRCVVSEIIKKMLLKDAREIVEHLAPDVMSRLLEETSVRDQVDKGFHEAVNKLVEGGWRYSSTKATLSREAKERVQSTVDAHVKTYIDGLTERKIDLFKSAEDRVMADLPGRVERYMDKCVSHYFERDVAAEVNRRIKAASQISE